MLLLLAAECRLPICCYLNVHQLAIAKLFYKPVYIGNCSSNQEINLEQVSSSGNDHYQFGIELTTASSCHCVTIVNATGTFGTNLLNNNYNLWCKNIFGHCLNTLCASGTKNMIFGSRILNDNGFVILPLLRLIPPSLPSSGDNSTGVCPEDVKPSSPLITTISPMVESSSLELIASVSSSSSFHTNVEDHTFIMATPTNYFPHLSSSSPAIPTLPSSYSTTPTPDLSSSKENSTPISYSPLSPSPTMLFCLENGTWPMTPACTKANATSNDCGNNFTLVNG